MTRSERQELGISKWVDNNCCGCLVWPTGTGKTRAGMLAINKFLLKNPGKFITVVVPTEVLQTQWKNVLYEHGLFLNVSVRIINSAIKEKWMCDMLILDECHRYSSDTFKDIVERSNYKIILGLSATYERLDGRHKDIMDKYCPVCDEITIDECLKNKWISPVKQYLVMLSVDDIGDYHQLNADFLNHFAFFNNDFDTAMKCATDYKYRLSQIKLLSRGQPEKVAKDISKIVHANAFGFVRTLKERKAFIYNHPKKIEIANLILEHRKDKKAITFWKSIKMAEKVGHGYVLHSKQTKKKRSTTMEDFSKLKVGVINSVKALVEGVDCPGLNLGIIGGFDSSKTTKTQSVGRICRFEEGKEAELFVLCIKDTKEDAWFRNSNTTEYVTINEDQLRDLLTKNEYSISKNKNDGKFDFTFRY